MSALLLVVVGCRDAPTVTAAPALARDAGPRPASLPDERDGGVPRTEPDPEPRDGGGRDAGPDVAAQPKPQLAIRFLGVGGFVITVGDDRVLTAPFFSNPSLGDVLSGQIRSDHRVIDRYLDPTDVIGTKAILVGHAHYDHLMDVPYVLQSTPDALVYGNIDAKRLLASFAPQPPAGCPTSTVARPQVPPERVVALNAPQDDRVDYRMCASRHGDCAGAWDGRSGAWVDVPSSRIRIRALCSMHPDQFLVFHLGGGCVDEDVCAPPARASDWREGSTLAYLIDFLDEDGRPTFRVYYQDAPTEGPVGYPHADLLADKAIDVALLCVGSYDQVSDQPQHTIAALDARYVIAGHWESFFRTQDEPLTDIPFLDVDEYVRRMDDALPTPANIPIVVDGVTTNRRGFKPDPGTTFVVSPQ